MDQPPLEPGRALDARVAEAMGLALDYEFAEEQGAPSVPALRDQYDEWGYLPHYSTDRESAWQIVDWLIAHHQAVQIEELSRYVRVRIRRGNQTRWPIDKELFKENSTAYAICLAFLDTIAKGPL